ncbi:MAG TPA: glycosyltransferase family 4 protein [Paludibacter sp.]
MNKKKVLFVANIAKHILRFHLPYLQWFQENGYETHVAANGDEDIPYCDVKHNVPIARSPFSPKNFHAYKVLKHIIDKNDFALVHCHTPMGGVLTRLAGVDSRKKGTKVLYTAHGFYFFKGAPLLSWLLYYPFEKFLASYTDGIVTINKEDYQLLIEKKFNTPKKYQINGIGVNEKRFLPVTASEKNILRSELGYHEEQFILVYVAEFISRKNHQFIIEAISELVKIIPQLKILFAGRGKLLEEMKQMAISKGITSSIDFMGFRNDIEKVMAIADVGISASWTEGLPINLTEEMFTGLPIVASDVRGQRELIVHGLNGYLYQLNNQSEFVKFISLLYIQPALREKFGQKSKELAQKFTLEQSVASMADIYQQILKIR